MEKNKSTITYRFDHNPKSQQNSKSEQQIIPLNKEDYEVRETPSCHPVEDPPGLNQYTMDFGAWSSPFEAEVERLEKLIKETDHPDHPADQGSAGPPPYRHDDQDEMRFGPIVTDQAYDPFVEMEPARTRMRGKPGAPWMTLLLSVGGAIATGAIFGFFVLQLFTGSAPSPVDIAADGDVQEQMPAGMEAGSGTETGTGTDPNSNPVLTPPSSTDQAVSIPAQSYIMLQHGVFSNEEGAQTAVEQLKGSGFAASMQQGEQFHVFAGVTMNRDDALYLSHILKEADKEAYVKTYSLPALSSVKWGGAEMDELTQFFEENHNMMESMANLSLLHLQATETSPFEEETMRTMQTAHQSWMKLETSLEQQANEEIKRILQTMNQAMNVAMNALTEYTRNPSRAFLWQVQTAMMDVMMQEKNLRNALSAS
ncbi:SPOR domain-containing protein [Marinicrinis sediminis]|uniref:SPOR domain-containing protein n=1 Tax=Marinicrinis sediminis TaxID=1652465 RepID=A0ABW5R643_9BACL